MCASIIYLYVHMIIYRMCSRLVSARISNDDAEKICVFSIHINLLKETALFQ